MSSTRAQTSKARGGKPRRVLGYARVSSAEQALGSSLDDQQRAISAHAVKAGLSVAHFYVEAESAVHEKIERREQIRALLAEVREGDLVVCDKIDRWSRDPEFTYGSIRKVLEAGASFYAVSDQCDPSTRDGDTMLHVRVLVAREEHKRIRERMVGTRKLLRDRGYYSEGLPPFGYRRSLPKGEKGPEKNVLVPDEPANDAGQSPASKVRAAFRLCIAGRSLAQIGAELGLTKDLVSTIVRSRLYLGEIENSAGEWIKARHPALVDAATFTRAAAALDARRLGGARPRSAPAETSDWILRDVARCAGCGSRMGAAYGGTPGARRYYLRCVGRCGAAYVPVRALEEFAEPLVVARLEELREELAREPVRPEAPRPALDLSQKRTALQRRREKFLEAFADDLMTRDELRAAMAKLDAQALALDGQEAAQRRPSPIDEQAARRAALRRVGAIRKAWKLATPADRRAIVGELATAARVAAGPACSFDWRTAEELAEP